MEDLSHLSLLRYEFSRMKPFPLLGERLEDFFAHNLFYSSDLHMTCFRHKTMQDFFENPEYTALKPFLFEDCAIVSDHRTMPEATWPLCQSILTDTTCQNEIKRLRQLFTTTKECLIHTDLHSSNIMVDEATVKIIDTEFAGFGPIAQDFGRLTASFCLNYLSWLGDDGSYTPAARLAYQESVLDILETMYTRFESTFQSLCQENQADSYILKSLDVEGYLRSHFVDALSYTALNAAPVSPTGDYAAIWLVCPRKNASIPSSLFSSSAAHCSPVVDVWGTLPNSPHYCANYRSNIPGILNF
ncbi:phosphotransferase [Eubacterium aggregans]|uniref:phosphotransferase n=1 Tax=Eubacterium aggregans TaxID=81409 RepID=UPI003F352E03